MKIRQCILMLMAAATLPGIGSAQFQASGGDAPGAAASVTSNPIGPRYQRPTHTTMVNNYLYETFGPYPIVGSAFAAGIYQIDNSPPEWHQGFAGYSRRFGSDFGISAVRTTTRYALAQASKQDTLYYRCECRGFLPRFGHAVLSTFTARQGDDGHRVFSIPALVSPYAGAMTGVYAWYPDRFGVKDGFRMGNYSLLSYMGGNVALEFLPRRSHSFLTRFHMTNAHGAPESGERR